MRAREVVPMVWAAAFAVALSISSWYAGSTLSEKARLERRVAALERQAAENRRALAQLERDAAFVSLAEEFVHAARAHGVPATSWSRYPYEHREAVDPGAAMARLAPLSGEPARLFRPEMLFVGRAGLASAAGSRVTLTDLPRLRATEYVLEYRGQVYVIDVED